MNIAINPRDKWLSLGLALVGGYGDAAGFILAKTFCGHITGSLVLGAVAVSSLDWRGVVAHFSAVVCFLAGIPLSVFIAQLTSRSASWPPLYISMGIEVILALSAYIALASHLALHVELFVICLSLALGLQNGAFRHVGGISVHTTYLTGMITGLLSTVSQKYAVPVSPGPQADAKSSLLFAMWGAFVVGACTGAAMAFHFRSVSMLGLASILVILIIRGVAMRQHVEA